MFLKSWQISQVSFQGLNSLLSLLVLFRFLLAFLFKIINVFVSSLYLQGQLYISLYNSLSIPECSVSPLHTKTQDHFNSAAFLLTWLKISCFSQVKEEVLKHF